MKVQSRIIDSSLVVWEAVWRESNMSKPSDKLPISGRDKVLGCNGNVNVEVASLHATPVAETVDNARRQQEPNERSLTHWFSPAGYQRRHDTKVNISTGEALDLRGRNLLEEAVPITSNGKWDGRDQGGGSGRSTEDRRAAKRVGREGPGPESNANVNSEARVR